MTGQITLPDLNVTVDPGCGMKVCPAKATATEEYDGMRYFFCSAGCAAKFRADPNKYLSKQSLEKKPKANASAETKADYVCPMHPEVSQETARPNSYGPSAAYSKPERETGGLPVDHLAHDLVTRYEVRNQSLVTLDDGEVRSTTPAREQAKEHVSASRNDRESTWLHPRYGGGGSGRDWRRPDRNTSIYTSDFWHPM
jgi:YHS domain-containing protein